MSGRLLGHAAELESAVARWRRAETALAERTRLAALDSDLGKTLIAGDRLRPTLQRCAECLVEHLGAAFARIWTLDTSGTTLELQASAGLYTHLDGPHSRVPVGALKIGVIAATREPHLTNSVRDDPYVDQEWARREGMVAFVGYPLAIEARTMGVMAMFAREPFTGFTLEALTAVANEIALGIERKRTVEELTRSEERFRSLVLAGTQMVWTANPQGEVVEELRAWTDYSGQSFAEHRGQGWADAIHPEDRPQLLAAWSRAVATGQTFEFEARMRGADGNYGTFQNRAVPVRDASGAIREWVGICIDITERKKLEEQLRHGQKIEAVGQLAGGIAHDFNNLLTVILGYGAVVAAQVADDPHLVRDLDEILLAGERAAALTRQLLTFSRKQVMQPRLLELNEVVRGVEPMLRRLIGEDIELSIALAPDLGHVHADPGQVEQVIVNLAINARDAMTAGGKLTIETAEVDLDVASAAEHTELQAGRYVQLTVTDSGTGIDPEVRRHLFEPFFTTKEPGKGTGLGLATSYGIVRQSGGHIGVDSEVGRGTSFKVLLPRAKHASAVEVREAPVLAPPGKETVLLVEDDAALRRLTRTILQGKGYRVLEAGSAAAALEEVAQHPEGIDLLLTDVVMPGLNGPDLARRLRSLRPEVRILFMSGYSDGAVLRPGVLGPGTAFLGKPFRADALAHKVREVLDGADWGSQGVPPYVP
ncbi:MAG TPA: ATP-binding protein [Thermoanaerobaculia bacterium]|nr:ATP-binding protein [Thermoanaerobaculia bacterium]